jgi:hydroxymethylpyrimidine/phosphomethylpyrimidine kinase
VALTIAGSDSGGGAGIQADLKTFQAFGVFGTSALTAITAQNTLGVQAVMALPPDLVKQQIRSVVSDLNPAACKSGMLGTPEIVHCVADALQESGLRGYVLDPVMVATSGDRLLEAGAVDDVRTRLVPLCTLVTPNLDEAERLVGFEVRDEAAMGRAARALKEQGAGAVLIKGGHLGGAEILDLLLEGKEPVAFRRRRVRADRLHGSGCTLSAAITAALARGVSLRPAVTAAIDFVHRAIEQRPRLGAGASPLNHFVPPPPLPPEPRPAGATSAPR